MNRVNLGVRMKSRRYTALALSALIGCGLVACEAGHQLASNVNVANGVVDNGSFASTVYVDMTSTKLDGSVGPQIDNVGTFVDVGSPNYKVLVLSLADAFQQADNESAVLPLLASLNLKVYFSDVSAAPLELNNLRFDASGNLNNGLRLLIVGASAQRNPTVAFPSALEAVGLDEASIQAKADRLFMSDPLAGKSGIEFRNRYTSFLLLAIPNGLAPALQNNVSATPLLVAEQRPDEASLASGGQLKIVGFGDTSSAAQNASTSVVSHQTKRNVADVEPLNAASPFTPLHALVASEPFAKQIWEIKGSGLCSQGGGRNYDTGAAVYWVRSSDGQKYFVGFVPRSTSIKHNYVGSIGCAETTPEDMASLVISPAGPHIDRLKALLQ